MAEIILTKVCTTCKNAFPATLDYFHKQKQGRFGICSTCKPCQAIISKGYRHTPVVYRPVEIKECSTCHKTFPATSEWFARDCTKPSGFQSQCKPCRHLYMYTLRCENIDIFHMQEQRRYAAGDPEVRKIRARATRQRNLEKIRARDRIAAQAKRDENPEEYRKQQRIRRIESPEVFVAAEQRRRARKRQAPINDLSAKQILEIKHAYGCRCVYCGKKFPLDKLTMDHISPIGPEGPNTLHNVAPACRSCNSKKQRKPPSIPVQPLLLTLAPIKKARQSSSSASPDSSLSDVSPSSSASLSSSSEFLPSLRSSSGSRSRKPPSGSGVKPRNSDLNS